MPERMKFNFFWNWLRTFKPWINQLYLIETDFIWLRHFSLRNFMKKILITRFSFTVEIISEDSVLKWYREAHSPKGKMHFLEKMRPFMEWLQNAEEGKRR